MFTGIIEQLGLVKKIQNKSGITKLGIELDLGDKKINTGDSISVNGACLTVVEIKDKIVFFDVVQESLNKSNLSLLKINDRVNVEFSLKADDRLNGHFVTGHIDCLGKIKKKNKEKDAVYFEISYPEEFNKLVAPKGSVAVNGISLTIVGDYDGCFSFYVIPHTINNTNLKKLRAGDSVNIEFDILAKYTRKNFYFQSSSSKLTKEFLEKKGFI